MHKIYACPINYSTIIPDKLQYYHSMHTNRNTLVRARSMHARSRYINLPLPLLLGPASPSFKALCVTKMRETPYSGLFSEH